MIQLPSMRDSDLPDADTLPCMLVWLSIDGGVLRTNRAFAEFTGVSYTTDAGLKLPTLLSADSATALSTSLQGQRDFTLNLRMPRSRSSSWADAWLDCSARWLPAHGCYLCAVHDMTEARLAELSARGRADQFQLLADNLPVLGDRAHLRADHRRRGGRGHPALRRLPAVGAQAHVV
jgi:PAS domain-containing protein